IPGHIVRTDGQAVAILTIQPIREGHVLVIPREEVDHWDDLAPELVSHLALVSQKIAKGLKRSYPTRRVGVMIAGLEVPHTHVHLVPMDSMADLSFDSVRDASADELRATAERIRASLLKLGYSEAEV